jgi:large repetitive protein
VRALDRAGNVGAAAAHAWTIDLTAPETQITDRPLDPSNSSAPSFSFSGTDNVSAASALRFQCRLDSAAEAAWEACASPQSYRDLGAGRHSFEVRAIDAAGNLDASPDSSSWTIDLTAPESSLTERPPDPSNESSARFSFAGSDDLSAPAALRFQCRLDSAQETAYAACSSPALYDGLGAGQHSFEVRALDQAGNVDASPDSHSWTIDTSAPETGIGDKPPATTTNTSATFSFSSSEAGASFECALDGAAFAACGSPKEYSGLAVGAHQFRVRASDAAGNIDATPASYSWTIEAAGTCAGPSTVTARADADGWVLESSSSSNYGNDSVVKVDTKAGANARALFRFALPAIPPGCEVTDARLRLFASSYKAGRTLQALRLGATWTESSVTWNSQPAAAPGPTASVISPSSSSYVQWSVTPQVQSMYSSGNHGFLIRDSIESGKGMEQAFHSREKGTDNPPQLVITFG